MRWTVEEVARALGVTPPGGVEPLARLAGVSINSRTVARGELFVAIHGPRHDGHNFVVAALDSGALAGVAILTHTQLLLILIGGVFAAETLSVIIQVVSYKTTRRRVFRMSPLHHHFELAGWPETKVTHRFWLASWVLSLLGFALITRTA